MGALDGVRVIEVGGIGPGPVCGMMLADMGAEVILIQRARPDGMPPHEGDPDSFGDAAIFNRSKKSIVLDLKREDHQQVALDLIASADALIEGFRPGVMERLGLGPDICLERNPKLVFGRMTGWGQDGPLASAAGHDINYIALSGALYHSGHADETPFAPPTLVGDVGGGSMLLATGILGGLLSARQTGKGQVVDAAIVDGSALLTTLLRSFHHLGFWRDQRGCNVLDSAAPWYECYRCADGEFITVGSLEPQFYALLVKHCGLQDEPDFANQFDKASWPAAKQRIAALFASKTRQDWCDLLEGTDICFAPALSLSEAPTHPHNAARKAFVEVAGVTQPAPAPRFSGTPSANPAPPPPRGAHTGDLLKGLGYSTDKIAELTRSD